MPVIISDLFSKIEVSAVTFIHSEVISRVKDEHCFLSDTTEPG